MILTNCTGVARAAFFTLICLLLFYYYGFTTFYRDPGSVFYDASRALDRSYSFHREFEANSFRDKAFFAMSMNRTDMMPLWKSGPSPTICAVVVTAARDDTKSVHPLELFVTSVLAGLTQVEREDVDLRVYFANTVPSKHPLWDSWLLGLVDRLVTAEDIASPEQLETLRRLEQEKTFYWKTSLDFSFALESCYKDSSAPYIALFEGDVLVADGWIARSRAGLEEIARHAEHNNEAWLDMRLFNEERSIGWASSALLGNNVPAIAVGLSVLLAAIVSLARRFAKLRLFTTPTLAFLCVVSVPIATILFFRAGKSSMFPPRAGVAIQDWGCCTQGLIFPRKQVPHLVEMLRAKAATKATDLLIMDHATDMRLRRWVLNPVQVQHLGFDSILSPDRPRDQAVWSVAFENLRPESLRKDHAALVSKIYKDVGTD